MTSLDLVIPIDRECTKCSTVKPLSEFYKDRKGRMGKSMQCKNCRRNAIDAHYNTLSEEEKKRRRTPYINGDYCKAASYKKKYGISLDDVSKMHQEQMGLCANRGCGLRIDLDNKPPHKHKAVVDHNHETGKVRGLLCFKCNTSLGLLEDKNVVLGLTEYLHKYDVIPSHLRGN